MDCHYCGRPADLTVAADGVQVGLCEEHFRERLAALTESPEFEELRSDLDVDRA